MSIEQEVLETLRALPPDKQAEVRDFADSLLRHSSTSGPRKRLGGMLAHLNIDISEEDIDEVRREMWKNFPRDEPR